MVHKMILPDVNGILLVAGSWCPLWASLYEPSGSWGPLVTPWRELVVEWGQLIGVILGILVSLLAVVDFCMKINWKLKRIKEDKQKASSCADVPKECEGSCKATDDDK